MKTKIFFFLVMNLCVIPLIYSQQIKGTIVGNNEPLPGVTVRIQELNIGTATDLDGNFYLNISTPGSYILNISCIGYQPKNIDIELTTENIDLKLIHLESRDSELNEIVVTGAMGPSQMKAYNIKKNSPAMIDVIASDAIGKLPDRNAAEAIQRIKGVAIERDLGEIDVYYDPSGGRFANPASYRFFEEKGIGNLLAFKQEGLEKSGFKVLHIADLDVRSHYPDFKDALQAIKQWSDKNPNHIPLYIMIEAKDSETPIFPAHTEVLKFDEQAFSDLDDEILSVISREKIISPDDVRQDYKTLREAVLAKNWPLVKDSRGKFLFMLLPSTAGLDSDHSPYVNNHPNLANRVMFLQSLPTDDFAAFLLMDNAIMRQEEIKKYVSDGYLVRTRSDIDTYEAKINDYTRAEAAFSSGAQLISTDFFMEGKNTYGNDYRVVIPNAKVARANPVNMSRF